MVKVGDRVRLIKGGDKWPLFGFKSGAVYKVGEPEGLHDDYPITLSAEGRSDGYCSEDMIELVTEKQTITGPATITVAEGETVTIEGNVTVDQHWIPKFGDKVVFKDGNEPFDFHGDFGTIGGSAESGEFRVNYDDGDGGDYVMRALTKLSPYQE